MDKDQLGLAIEGLGIYSRELSPAYQAIRERLAGSLAINGMMLDEMRFQRESIGPNRDLVNSFINLLPHTDSDNNFVVHETFTARMLEGNVAWVPTSTYVDQKWNNSTRRMDSIFEVKVRPYYIIGESASSRSKNCTGLLLSAASTDQTAEYRITNGHPVVTEVKTDEKEIAEQLIEQRAAMPFTEEKMAHMFNGSSLTINADNAEGLVHKDFMRPSKRKLARTINSVGGIKIAQPHALEQGLTNDTLAQFGVLDRFNRLAVAFGKVNELEALLKEQQEKAPKNPLDKYFQPES